MIDRNEMPTRTFALRTEDRDLEQRTMLLHIAVSCPYDATELARRFSRSPKAIQDDLTTLMAAGTVHLHDGTLRTGAAARIISEATPTALREVHDQVLAELATGAAARPATLAALAESGCTDEALLHLLIRAVGQHPEDTALISAVAATARARGHSENDLHLLRAADAASRGRAEEVLSITDGLMSASDPHTSARAATLSAAAHIQANRLERATALYQHVGTEQIADDAAWAVVAAIGHGDLAAARDWRAAISDNSLTNQLAGLLAMADGLLESVEGHGDGALDLLARSVSALAPLGPNIPLPESPAALAAIVAIGRGEPATAEMLLERALRANLGGIVGRRRHLLLFAWSLMAQGQLDSAESALANLDTTQELCDRDQLFYWSLRAGIARRKTDMAAMKDTWREMRGHTFGMSLTLYDLLPLGEMMVVAARLNDSGRIQGMVVHALAILDALGAPIAWSAPLHWAGVHTAIQAGDPASLIPHANALVRAGKTNRYAATLAQAGNTWLEVLRRETDFAAVEASARALANSGLAWDAARLASQAALQHPERDGALAMMHLAREISKGHAEQTQPAPKSSLLTTRELEVGRLVLDGQGYRSIGEQLFISPKTVEHHVARIRSRFGASSRAELLEKLHDAISELDR